MKKLSLHYVHHVPKYIVASKLLLCPFSVKFRHFVCYGLIMTTYREIWFLKLLLLV